MITAFSPDRTLNLRLFSLTPGRCLALILLLLDVCALVAGDIPTMLIVTSSLVAYGVATRFSKQALSDVLLFITVSTAIVAIGQYAVGIPMRAWTGNPNLVAYISTIGVAVAYDRRAFIWLWILSGSIVLVNCTGAYIVLLAWLSWSWRGNWGVVLLSAAVLGIVLLANQQWSYSMRLNTWSQLANVRPFGAASVIYPVGMTHMHNLFGQIAVSYGWIPALLAAAVLGIAVFDILQLGTVPAAFGVVFVLVSSFVDYLYWWPGMAILVIATLAWSWMPNED